MFAEHLKRFRADGLVDLLVVCPGARRVARVEVVQRPVPVIAHGLDDLVCGLLRVAANLKVARVQRPECVTAVLAPP